MSRAQKWNQCSFTSKEHCGKREREEGREESGEEERLPSTRAVLDFLEKQGGRSVKTMSKCLLNHRVLELERLPGDYRLLLPLSPGHRT